VDYRTDIFSLGVVLYEMVSGARPFDGQSATAILDAIQRQPPAPVEINDPAFSSSQRPLNAIISTALAKDRAARYGSAAEMQADLRTLAHALEAPAANLLGKIGQPPPSPVWWSGIKGKAALAAGALAFLVGLWLLRTQTGSGPNAPSLGVKEARRLTDQAGYKLFPSLSPDGRRVVYASRIGTNWDIYLQKIGSRETVNLTADSPHVDLHPTFAPDGNRIAFYSSRGGGSGVFLMDANGAHVRELTNEGYNPAWSPDGQEIAYATDRIFDHEGRIKSSQIWAVNVATKARRIVTDRDAVQPNWSPSGARIAFWGTHKGGRRDIWTVAARGGEPVAVTNDEYIDWNPVWARDGHHLYFLSNRGGGMNLWRVPINEATGKVVGAPEPMTLPSASSQHLSFSGDGRNMVYVQMNRREDLWQVAFDPVAGKIAGAPARLTQGARRHSYPELSPDDRLILFTTLGETQEDLFVLNPDGTGGRQLTDDRFRNRNSHWSPDGRQIALASDRNGKYEIWLMNRDGSDLRQLTAVPDGDAAVPVWSPDGLRLVYLVANRAYAIEPSKPFAAQTPQPLAGAPPQNFSLWSWSPDGNFLAGWEVRPERQDGGVLLYSFAAQAYERLTDRGRQPIWLNDGRRLLFVDLGKLYLLDRTTGQWSAIHAVLPDNIGGCTLSRDNRTLYYSQARNETDLWLLTLR
jgi:Tol biopolymer transport system component